MPRYTITHENVTYGGVPYVKGDTIEASVEDFKRALSEVAEPEAATLAKKKAQRLIDEALAAAKAEGDALVNAALAGDGGDTGEADLIAAATGAAATGAGAAPAGAAAPSGEDGSDGPGSARGPSGRGGRASATGTS